MTQQPKSKEKILSIADKSNPYTIPAFRSGFNEGFIKGWEAYAEQQRGCGRWVNLKGKDKRLPIPGQIFVKTWEGKKALFQHTGSVMSNINLSDQYDLWYDEQSPCECQQLREAAGELLHLHLCEQEGLQSGQPTPEMWFNAVDKLSEALSDAGNKED